MKNQPDDQGCLFADFNCEVSTKQPVNWAEQKSSSTSSLYIRDRLTSPNINLLLKWTAIAIHAHIKSGHAKKSQTFFEIFDETKHPLGAYNVSPVIPPLSTLYHFLDKIFVRERLPSEVAILCLVYIERLIKLTKITLHATNWRRVVVTALILAAKVWEEQAVWNVDFLKVFPLADVSDFNCLEKNMLALLQYNVAVTGAEYAQYYFELTKLSKGHLVLLPLSNEQAKRLEDSSREQEMSAKRGSARAKSYQSYNSDPKTATHVLS
eukprot:TRINITY_DN22458_c0_g1_i1.p1 TRINITY_DN22458_c0_g1~~TRINITY_DN22458_c0_g1_i1.p1  ORF type:complete len:266 (-),score=34.82 TRINITY_DN22458_c0_g1_i1:33-830(-)